MNKAQLQKLDGKLVRIWPRAERLVGGPGGVPLPPTEDKYLLRANKRDVSLYNVHTHHQLTVGHDQIREYSTDPMNADACGMLILKVQAHISGCYAWTTPIVYGIPMTDQFERVHGWERKDDKAYLRSLFPEKPTALTTPQVAGRNPVLGLALFACVCFGVAAIANV